MAHSDWSKKPRLIQEKGSARDYEALSRIPRLAAIRRRNAKKREEQRKAHAMDWTQSAHLNSPERIAAAKARLPYKDED